MPEENLDVVPAELRTHAGSVDGVASAVDEARAAGTTVKLGRDAYGKLCQLIPALLDPIQQMGIDALAEAVTALQSTADRLRTAAGDYTGTDDAAAGRFTGNGGGRTYAV